MNHTEKTLYTGGTHTTSGGRDGDAREYRRRHPVGELVNVSSSTRCRGRVVGM